MVLSIGIGYSKGSWKTCLMENGRLLELRLFSNAPATVDYVQQIRSVFPDPIPKGLLIAIDSIYFNSFSLPAIRELPTIPAFRRRNRFDMGTSHQLCAVTTLLYRMRMQEATWQEMRFLYLDVNQNMRSIIAVENGRIVNGLGETVGVYPYRVPPQELVEHVDWSKDRESEAMAEQAFWEGLTQDLAGLMAVHHLEDIVVTGPRKDVVINRLEDKYQFYNFPYENHEEEGFEAATGAAIIAEGLYLPGPAAEVVERLQLLRAGRHFSRLSPQFIDTFLKKRGNKA